MRTHMPKPSKRMSYFIGRLILEGYRLPTRKATARLASLALESSQSRPSPESPPPEIVAPEKP